MATSDFTRLFDIPYYQKSRFPNKHCISIVRDNQNFDFTTDKMLEDINSLSAGLLEQGFKKGDRIGILSHHGSPEWNITDFACQQIGLIVVPLHHNYDDVDFKHILNEVELSACFISRVDWKEKFKKASIKEIPIYTFRKMEHEIYWEDLLIPLTPEKSAQVERYKNSIKPEDLATIVYTSGATGKPKGVMLSHDNICCNIKSIIALIPINYKSTVASFLPLSHIFERMVVYTYLSVGARVHYILDQKQILNEIRKIRPHYMTTVPRVLEKIYEGIKTEMHKKSFLQKKLVYWAMKKGKNYEAGNSGILGLFRITVADILVYRKWRKVLGGRIRGIIVGAAALPEELAKLFTAAGIPIREGYGLTETSPVVSFNRFEPGGSKFGTVGIPIPGVEVKIQHEIFEGSSIQLDPNEGEILVKGRNVMMGYYKNEQATKERFTDDGWFRTGDIGTFVHARFLKITDRRKDIFKTTSGRYIAPQKLEGILRANPYIDQCMVVGMGQAFPAVLIVPNFERLKQWCLKNEIHWTAPLYMLVNHKVEEFYQEKIDAFNLDVKPYEAIQKFALLAEEWSVDSGEYTPTLKLRRHYIIDKYSDALTSIYQ